MRIADRINTCNALTYAADFSYTYMSFCLFVWEDACKSIRLVL